MNPTAIRAVLVAFAALPLLAADVPDSYIDYVESTGAQYVDTGIEGRYGTKVEVRFTGWTGNSTALFGSVGDNSYNNNHFLTFRSTSNRLRFIYGPSGKSGDTYTAAGTLEVGEILKGSGIAEVTLNGGTLKPKKANASFLNKLNNVTLGAGGVMIDTAYDIGATSTTMTVQSGGKIVKTGTGTFDLSGITVQMDASIKSGFDFAVATEGADVGGFSGLPAVPGNWFARLSSDGKTCRIIPNGFMLIVR